MSDCSNIKLIVADMDGTLLDDKKQIDNEMIPLLKQLKERNILLTLASGRNIHIMKSFVEELSIELPIITNNGATLYLNNKCIYEKSMHIDELTYALNLLTNKDIPYIAYAKEGVYILEEDDRFQFFLSRLRGKTDIYKASKLSDITFHSIFKVVVIHEDTAYMSDVMNAINAHCTNLHIVRSEGSIYTLTHILATKGETLKRILDMYNIGANEVLAFGDNYNDISLFKCARISVAMSNAEEEVKKEATFITKTNNEHGVSIFIKNYLINN
ncbi:MAG: HAD family hydrolase [Longicatena sp.]